MKFYLFFYRQYIHKDHLRQPSWGVFKFGLQALLGTPFQVWKDEAYLHLYLYACHLVWMTSVHCLQGAYSNTWASRWYFQITLIYFATFHLGTYRFCALCSWCSHRHIYSFVRFKVLDWVQCIDGLIATMFSFDWAWNSCSYFLWITWYYERVFVQNTYDVFSCYVEVM